MYCFARYLLRMTFLLFLVGLFGNARAQTQSFSVASPNKNVTVTIHLDNKIQYEVSYQGVQFLKPSSISMNIQGVGQLGDQPKVTNSAKKQVDQVVHPVVPRKSAEVADHYNELTLSFQKNFQLVFRAYNDGVAYRFKTSLDQQSVKVQSEQLSLNFAGDYTIYFPEEESFMTHQERIYKQLKLTDITSERFSSIPALVKTDEGTNVFISESDLQDYPGFYLQGTASQKLTGIMPHVATEETLQTDRNYFVTKRADYIAQTAGDRSYPWRLLGISENDADLLTNQMVYKLAEPNKLTESSWINPGKVSWDWWNANNIYDVDFKAGINTQTYKYYIDFAARMGLDYIILDEGWYKLGDLLKVSPNMDIQELVEYGRKKNVGVILWVVWKTLDDQWEQAFDQFSKWGIKGIKVDFMQRDDQWMVNWYWKVAEEAAKRKLLVDFHGSYKPAGLSRTYPNVITREGVKGLENSKWGDEVTPHHDLMIPFIRMVAGPMDFTPGAMINAQPQSFKPIFDRPMSQGTRMHQLAMYVVYESPLQMLADSPTHYLEAKQSIRDYLSEVPVTWDETKVLDAAIGEYVVVARRKGDRWYIGGMTNEEERSISVDLSFLENGNYTATFYKDGINANRYASDFTVTSKTVSSGQNIEVHMAKGGGWVVVIEYNK